MQNHNNLRSYLQSHNPRKGAKTFSLMGLEKKMSFPRGTLDYFIKEKRGIKDTDSHSLVDFLKTIAYKDKTSLLSYLKEISEILNVSGVECKLNMPPKTLRHFVAGRRGLGDWEETVTNFVKKLGYDENITYDNFL